MSSRITYKGNTLTTVSNATKVLDTAGTYLEDDITIVDVSESSPVLQTKTKEYTPTETSQVETISADSAYDALEQVEVTVNAISSSYVGSSITRRSSTDLTTNANTVNVPEGYYESAASKAISTGTAGTPTATKGTVTDHVISITPSVTNTTGYITGGTKTGTAVSVSASELVSGSKDITTNATGIDVTNYASVNVAVPSESPNLQSKTATPTETSQLIEPDTGYDGLSDVTVSAISSTYVGSGIARKSSSDLTVSDATVSAPAGYYASSASKAVSSMTLPTSASSSATSGYTSKATISRSTADQYINIPTGYNSSGAYYKISATPDGSVTAPSSITGTSASISTGTNTLTLSKTISVTPNVTTAGYISSGTAGNSSVSLTASVTTMSAATITPGTSNQTIASGTYLTGTQTISGDANLVGSNILSGKSIFGVAGTVTFQTYYSGSSTPSSSTGVDGDIYLKTS